MNVLVIDVGGNNVKVIATGRKRPIRIPSGPKMTAAGMASAVKKATADWKYEAVSIGFPGPVRNDRPSAEPVNLGPGWVRFDYKKAFGRPLRLVNDAALQALGSYHGGRMLFLGLGTGLGSALVADGILEPLELAHLPYRKNRSYEDYLGHRGLKRQGRRKWTEHVARVVELLKHGLQVDYVVLGGGEARKLKKVPRGARLGRNSNAFLGGYRLWEDPTNRHRRQRVAPSQPPKSTSAEEGEAPHIAE
jgi:predicted NBD/HSP70 family sugar kinase